MHAAHIGGSAHCRVRLFHTFGFRPGPDAVPVAPGDDRGVGTERPPIEPARAAVDLYWLPLGAGGRSVRMNGRIFEAVAARLAHRTACDLYHAAIVIDLPDRGRFVIEQAPVPDARGAERGVVIEGPVGARWAARARIFRYEVRRWHDGVIPDIGEAVESPRRLTTDPRVARRLWESVSDLPAPVWGRDELHTGEMWNSNSVVSWLLTRSGVDAAAIALPAGGRAPGWDAGIVAARRRRG